MSLLKMSAASTDFVEVEITSSENPVAQPVSFAFVTSHLLSDAPGTVWTPGSWYTDANGVFWARCFVGPEGAITLPRGLYLMYVKWEMGSLKPADCSGTLEVY
jgi:hypothetical protein